jgi:uncharacterized Tic20 family protein
VLAWTPSEQHLSSDENLLAHSDCVVSQATGDAIHFLLSKTVLCILAFVVTAVNLRVVWIAGEISLINAESLFTVRGYVSISEVG